MLLPDDRSLHAVIARILDHLTPTTRDKNVLDLITIEQLKDATYRENVVLDQTSYGNFLVPQGLYQIKLNQTWLFPPSMEFGFRATRTGENPKIVITAGFGVPRYLAYKEYRQSGSRITLREISRCMSLPEGFTGIDVDGRYYDIRDGDSVQRRSVSPLFFSITEEVKLDKLQQGPVTLPLHVPNKEIILKRYDQRTGSVQSATGDEREDRGLIEESGEAHPGVATIRLMNAEVDVFLEIRLERTASSGEFFIVVRMVNSSRYSQPHPMPSQWRPLCILSPYVTVKLENLDAITGPQQYEEARDAALADERNSNPIGNSHIQINGVLTRSTVDKSLLVGTPFGVFDQLREDPIPYEKTIDEMLVSDQTLLKCFPDECQEIMSSKSDLLKSLGLILRAIKGGFGVDRLYRYQWDAITQRAYLIATEEHGTTTIVKAPTGAGKTVVFMGNAALHFLATGERAALVFPTRILNEDMFKRLTQFVYHLRRLGANVSGGIYIGYSDPLYSAVADPEPGQHMIQFGSCPNCAGTGCVVAKKIGYRILGECQKCNHVIDYMYGVKEVGDYLPSLTIATPDKLFYDATAAKYEMFNLRNFGGHYAKCSCGVCVPSMGTGKLKCRVCGKDIPATEPRKSTPIQYFVFDEVHSLYGITGTFLSIFMRTLQLVADKIRYPEYRGQDFLTKFTYETGTATIANEIELLTAITRVSQERVRIIPGNQEYDGYFALNRNRVRYRILLLLPVATSVRSSVPKAIYAQHLRTHHSESHRPILGEALQSLGGTGTEMDFQLGYVYRKRDGHNLARTINDQGRFDDDIEVGARFLSGDSSSREIAMIYSLAIQGQIRVLVANMVISLGIDIKNLNNMISMGVPKSMTEHVQTAGRTGRGAVPGHVTLHMWPSMPRDQFVYANFHEVFCDVAGYYDRLPIQSTNAFAAQVMFPNVMKAVLASMSYHNYVLTAPSAAYYFSRSNTREQLLMLDILRVLIHTDTPALVRQRIAGDVRRQLTTYIQRFAEYKGSQQYISDILLREHELLTSLRVSSGRDISVIATQGDLFQRLEDASRISTPTVTDVHEEQGVGDLDDGG